MDFLADLFNKAASQGTTDNLEVGTLTDITNIETFFLRKVLQAMSNEGVPSSDLGPEEDSTHLDELICQYRQKLEVLLKSRDLGVLCGMTVESWSMLPETGTFALFGMQPCSSVRLMVLPCKVEISCHPQDISVLTAYLRLAAFEAHVYGMALALVKEIDLRGVVVDVGSEVITLRQYISDYQGDLLSRVKNFLECVPQ